MSGILFIFLALITAIASFLLIKTVLKPGSSHDPVAYATISFILGATYAAILYAATSFHLQDFTALADIHVAALVGLDVCAWALGTCIFYPAYKHLPVSETTIIYSLQGLFAFVFGVLLFRNDTFQLVRLLGAILILISVALVNQSKGKWRLDKFGLMLIASTAIFGFATVVDNLIISHRYFSSVFFFVILNFGVTAIMVLLFRLGTIRKLKTVYGDRKALLTVLASSLGTFLTFVLVYNGYKLGVAASQSNLILSTQTVAIVLLGALLFRERNNLPKKLLAGLIAAIGVYFIS